MGRNTKESVEFVISHLPGCSGNFLARLISDVDVSEQKSFYRIDIDRNSDVAALDFLDFSKINQHRVVVLHDFDRKNLRYFPNAKHIAIYPYTNVGNIIYNITTKKVTPNIKNIKDQYYLWLQDWHKHIINKKPNYKCWNYNSLKDIDFLQKEIFKFNQNQIEFFYTYWKNQNQYNLNIPEKKSSMEDIICQNKIKNWFNDWSAIYAIYCYEYCNNICETQRQWSIDNLELTNWENLCSIQEQYNY